MIDDFQIGIAPRLERGESEARRLSVRLGQTYLTRLIRRGGTEPDECLEAPPLPLAFWFVDNWWRIRWEPAPPQREFPAQWQLAHHMPSVGAGYPWPNVSLWGEGDRCAVAVHANSHNLQRTLRFLAKPDLYYVSSSAVENAIDTFIDQAIQDAGAACDGLDFEYQDLQAERADPAASSWRRLEALLGFDVDCAPEGLVSQYEGMVERYGSHGVEEAALAHQGEHSASVLQGAVDAAEASKVVIRTPRVPHAPAPDPLLPPWQVAVSAARTLRQGLHIPRGPIRNGRLSEILGIKTSQIATQGSWSSQILYALRLRTTSGDGSRLALRSRWSLGRRFELCRSLGDMLWSGNDPLGPISTAKSPRQKFQRAFAQEFLCPFEDLRAYIRNEQPAEDDIQAAARHFHVSTRLVRATLANNHVIDQGTFAQMVDAA